MTITITVTPELNVGYGKIAAANRYANDSQTQQAAAEVRGFVKQVSDKAACGCIDGRCVMGTLAGQALLGPKLAGGIAETSLGSLELNDYFGDGKSILNHLGRTVELLEDGGLPVRFHIDANHRDYVMNQIKAYRQKLAPISSLDDFIAELETADIDYNGTGCGMGDQFVAATANLAERRRPHESDQQMQDRLAFIRTYTAAIKGDQFDQASFDRQMGRANHLVDSGHLEGWNSLKALIIADRALQDRGLKDGALPRIDVLENSDQGVSGHIEDFVVVNKVPGTTVDQTAYARATARQIFTVDDWMSQRIGHKMAPTGGTIAQAQAIAQAVTAMNLAGYVQLADGSQRAIIFS